MQFSDEQFKKEVMMRVKTTYIMKKVMRPLIIELALCGVFLIVLSMMVSVRDVLSNMFSQQTISYAMYLTKAFIHTHAAVQLTLIGAGILMLFIIKDSIRNISHIARMQMHR